MDGIHISKKKQEAITAAKLTFEQKQNIAWDTLRGYDQTSHINGVAGKDYSELDSKTLDQLLDVMQNDPGSKSEFYTLMYNSLRTLNDLADTNGQRLTKDGKLETVDFYEALFTAREHVSNYLFTHAGYHFTDKGDRRVQIAQRVQNILAGLEKRVKSEQQNMSEESLRMAQYRRDNWTEEQILEAEKQIKIEKNTAELTKIAQSGIYGPSLTGPEADEARDRWVVKGFTSVWEKMLNGTDSKLDKEKLDDFIAELENQNSKALANRLSVSIIADHATEVTLNLPWLKEELKTYICGKLSEEEWVDDPQKIATRIDGLVEDYKLANKERLAKFALRKKEIGKKLNISSEKSNFFEYSDVKTLMSAEDGAYEALLENYAATSQKNEELIKKILEPKFSVGTRDSIREKLNANLGALKIFGTVEQILNQTNLFLETIKYNASLEALSESALDNMLKSMSVDIAHKDSFVKAVTDNAPEKFLEYGIDYWEKKGAQFFKLYKTNNKSLLNFRQKQGLLLAEEDWEVLERLGEIAGTTSTDMFNELLSTFDPTNYTSHRKTLSRREYISGRNFRDANREPGRIKRVLEEKKRIEELNELSKDRFIVAFYMMPEDLAREDTTREDPYLEYRRLEASVRGTRDKQKVSEAREKERYKSRIPSVRQTLRAGGMSIADLDRYIKNCKWLISGIEDITEDMPDDVRLTIERKNLERFGVRNFSEALQRFESAARRRTSPEGEKELRSAGERYKAGYEKLKEYGEGKYEEYLDILVSIPEVFAAMTDPDPEKFEQFCSEKLDVRLGAFIEGMRRTRRDYKSGGNNPKSKGEVAAAVRKQYAFTYLKMIFDEDVYGDAQFFENDLHSYQNDFYKTRLDGKHTITDNLAEIIKEIRKETKKRKIIKSTKSDLLEGAAYQQALNMLDDTEGLRKLLDYKEAKNIARSFYALVEQQGTKDVNLATGSSITKSYKLNDEDKKQDEAFKKALKEREAGKTARQKYLQTNTGVLDSVRLGKSLVRVGEKGARRVDLNTKKADTMRGRIMKYIGEEKLPSVLRDALVEEGASEAFAARFRGIMWKNSKLSNHATSMKKLYQFLCLDRENGSGMIEEEAQMYIVKCYNTPEMRKYMFEDPDNLNVASIRESEDYKVFRENYAKLMNLESEEIEDPTLEDERIEMSRNLRAMLITGVGVKYENGKNWDLSEIKDETERINHQKEIGKIIEKNEKYVSYSAKLGKLIREVVEEDNNANNLRMDEYRINHKVYSARSYFLKTVIGELSSGAEFKEDEWKSRIRALHDDRRLWLNLSGRYLQVDSESRKRSQSFRVDSEYGEESIAQAIRDNTHVFKGNVNKYEMLDEDQKKFFALALMVMDKGSIGMGTEGTAALLTPKHVQSRISAEVEAELMKYIAGEPYHIEVDYKQAYNKLINYGETKFFYMEGYALSQSAYNKALHFAQTVYAKKKAFGERDDERLNNSEQSISIAVNFGKKAQRNKLDELRDKYLTVYDIRDLLVQYAADDVNARNTRLIKNTALTGLSMGHNLTATSEAYKDAVFVKKVSNLKKRFAKMTEDDMKLFVRVMQNRSMLDKTTIPKDPDDPDDEIPDYADQERRNTLLEALCGDAQTRTDVMTDFDSFDSCYQAIVNALGFQLRDDLNFKGKALAKDMYAKGALERTALVDWNLIENAFNFMDEIKEKRAYIAAMHNASDLIDVSGNKEAKEEYKKLREKYKDEKSFTKKDFEEYIKEQGKKEKSEEIDRILAGYHSLTDKEKNLFFKVVAQRDVLDISKKDYKKNFFGLADRNYVNQVGRDKLIDEYIESSLENNIGIMLDPGDHYNAMKSLFSTQLDDRQKFSSELSIAKMEAAERNAFMLRSTAIDWKLFRRALNFVNRASEELEYREGNAQLYRGAGSLSENGKFMMNYSFLRKNFHSTGNQWFRFIGRLAVRTVRDEAEVDDKLKLLLNQLRAVNVATKVLGAGEDNPVSSGIAWVTAQTKEFKSNIDRIDPNNITQAQKKANDKAREKRSKELAEARKKQGKTEKDKQKEKEEEQERRAKLGYCEAFYESANDIIENASSVSGAIQDVAKFMRTTYLTQFRVTQKYTETKKVQAKEDKNNLVNKMTAGTVQDTSNGDIRDAILKTAEKFGDVKDVVSDTAKTMDAIGLEDLRKMIGFATQKAIYKFVNLNLLNNPLDLTDDADKSLEDQATEYRNGAKKVADQFMEGVFRQVVGDEFADSIKQLESDYYDVSKIVQDHVKSTVRYIKYARRCAAHVTNVGKSIGGIKELRNSVGESKKQKDADDEKIKKAGAKRLSPKQLEVVENVRKKHHALAGLGNEIATVVQSFNIAENVLDIAFDTAETISKDVSIEAELITKSVKAALDFIMFAARVATDRVALNKYFIDTDAGNAVVNKIKDGFIKSGNLDGAKKIEDRMAAHKKSIADGNTSMVDLISDARGYEHTSELMENTAMSLAQSIVFSASKYNPLMETKIVAVTVMSVMGLGNKVGDISPRTVEQLFNSFKMKR